MTNNHPAHGPVSLDLLRQIREILSKAAAQSDGGNLGYAMADAVKVIDGVISVFGNAPVAVNDDMAYAFHHALSDASLGADEVEEIKTGLRAALANVTAQPAPVVPEVMADPDESQYGGTYDEDYQAECAYVEGWNACRAAMLQVAEQQNRQQNIPENIKTLHDGLAAIRNSGIAIDDEKIQAERDALNSPVTPDGWQLVPKEPTAAMNKAGWDAMNEHDAINPTYRAMLAAAPKQEVKAALEHGMQRYAGAMQKLSEGDK